MIKLLIILTTLFALSSHAVDKDWKEVHGDGTVTENQKNEANFKIKAFEGSTKTLELTATQTNLALRTMVLIGVKNLRRKGYYHDAKELRDGWAKLDGKLIEIVKHRNIGQFKPISKWLADAYDTLERKLGIEVCRTLRLTDIKTINFTIPVCFHLCFYGYSNFYDHFVTDEVYEGLLPVVSYWVSVATCEIGLYGVGYFFVCSPAAMLVERAVLVKIAPWAAPKLYGLSCK